MAFYCFNLKQFEYQVSHNIGVGWSFKESDSRLRPNRRQSTQKGFDQNDDDDTITRPVHWLIIKRWCDSLISIKCSNDHSFLKYYYVHLAEEYWWDYVWIGMLLLMELNLGCLIIWKVPYTEIDWMAYMEEVDCWWIDGEYDYRQIHGNTGPLVYPAGFLYLFRLLQWMTGRDIFKGQLIFLIFYIAIQGVVMMLYTLVIQQIRRQRQSQQETTKISSTTTTTTPNKDDETKNSNYHPTISSFHLVFESRHGMFMFVQTIPLHLSSTIVQ